MTSAAQLWPSDTFVDFDNGLNKSINQLRDTLGDSAESPTFIETLPRRGYRLVEPVTAASTDGSSTATIATRHRKFAAGVAIAAFAAVIAGRLLWAPAPLTEKDTIVLATAPTQPAVRCSTARFEKAFLEQSPFLRLVSDESIHETLRMMGQPPNARLSPEITR